MVTKSLEKVFKIINLLEKNGEMKLQDIAEDLNLAKSTAHRILAELKEESYVSRDIDSKKFKLGLKFVQVSSVVIDDLDIRKIARKNLEKLNKITQETVHLAMLIDDSPIYIDKVESTHAIRMYSEIGKPVLYHCTGVGKAILAFQPKRFQKSVIDFLKFRQFTKNTVSNKEDFIKELEEIKNKGYSIDNEEHEENIGCIAAPIRDSNGDVRAAMSITAILYRMNMDQLIRFNDILLKECEEISKKWGYVDNG